MKIGFIGSRGTIPTGDNATTCIILDNKFLFDCPSEIIYAFNQYKRAWNQLYQNSESNHLLDSSIPGLGKIRYIILSHLHWDHWGGIRHMLHRIMLFEKEKRQKEPLKIIIPRKSTYKFQERVYKTFIVKDSDFVHRDESEFLMDLLSIEIGEEINQILKIVVISDNETINLEKDVELIAKKNSHMSEGSFSYKIIFTQEKLNVEKAKALKIPFNHTLGKIQKGKVPIKVGSTLINKKDIFTERSLAFGYSGDTPYDESILEFFKDVDCLIHETTYLSDSENYHLDLHTNFQELMEGLNKVANLRVLIPIHFSIRYTNQEIAELITELNNKNEKMRIINPQDTLGLIIDFEKINTFKKKEITNLS